MICFDYFCILVIFIVKKESYTSVGLNNIVYLIISLSNDFAWFVSIRLIGNAKT